jgi:2,3-bisphosphoglycerate-independent phosphoglycerate mutase
MGNSEVGHQNIGAGRIVDQEIVRIDRALEEGTLGRSEALIRVVDAVRRNRSKLHLMGLCSDGGVHSVMRHVLGLLRLAKNASLPRVFVHVLTDGRDTAQKSAPAYLAMLEKTFAELELGACATVCGRFWAMDRDSRWERVERAYRCFTGGGAAVAPSAASAVMDYYEHPLAPTQIGDEFIPPTQILAADGTFPGAIGVGDGVIFFNFRGDRPREITRAFLDPQFSHFPRVPIPGLTYATMTEYESGLCPNVLFPKLPAMENILGAYLSRLNLRQFRTAETEKYAHVTFFFNDYREEPFPGEERKLIASPKDVATYDLKPEMSANAVCEAFVGALRSRAYDFLLVNFANPDMVGHTGNFEAARRASSTVDGCLGHILSAAAETKTNLVIGADHGNAEEMWDPVHGVPHTQHTTNPVEFFLYGPTCRGLKLRSGGCLADIAPTVLKIMGLPQPKEMTGKSLIAVP